MTTTVSSAPILLVCLFVVSKAHKAVRDHGAFSNDIQPPSPTRMKPEKFLNAFIVPPGAHPHADKHTHFQHSGICTGGKYGEMDQLSLTTV